MSGPLIVTPNTSATSREIQRAIGDAFTTASADLMAKYHLEPGQILKGLLAFTWDFNRLLVQKTTRDLVEQTLFNWSEMDRLSGRKG